MYYAHVVNNYINIITKDKEEVYSHDRDYTNYNNGWDRSEVVKGLKNISYATGLEIKEIKKSFIEQ